MGKEVDNKFTWVIKNFCSQQSRKIYSDEFFVDGCKWRILAFPKGNSVEYLSLYLDVAGSEYLPHGWRRHAEIHFTIVNQLSETLSQTKVTRHWFDASASDWGFTSMFPLNELHDKDSGFLVNGDLKIVVEVANLQVIGKLDVPEVSEETTKALSKLEENDAAESTDMLKEASLVKESMDVKLDVPEVSEETTKALSKLVENDAAESNDILKEASSVKESIDVKLPEVSEETTKALSKLEENDAAESNDMLKEASSVKESMDVKLDVPEVSEETTKALSKLEENDAAESNDLLKEVSSVKESMDVNGFRVLPSQVESVSCIFERHPDIASEFRPKNQHLRSAYMNVLLSLIETMCQSTQELSKGDLTDAYAALAYLTDAGLNLNWLEEKLEEVSEKKEKEEAGETRMQEIEEELKELKQKCSNLEAQLEKEKEDVSVARAPLSFDDVV